VVGLDLPEYGTWRHYEQAALHSGPRYTHEKFCVVSDRPTILKVDEMNRPHCETGPFCEWADGTKLYAWRGVRVPAWWIETPEKLDPMMVLTHDNMEEQQALEGAIQKAVQEIIAENPQAVEDYKKGKQNAVQFLIGRTMGKLKGQGNPDVIGKVVQEELNA